jgi:hypothetical protein
MRRTRARKRTGKFSGCARTVLPSVRSQPRTTLISIVREQTRASRAPQMDLYRRDSIEGICTDGRSTRQETRLSASASRRSFALRVGSQVRGDVSRTLSSSRSFVGGLDRVAGSSWQLRLFAARNLPAYQGRRRYAVRTPQCRRRLSGPTRRGTRSRAA